MFEGRLAGYCKRIDRTNTTIWMKDGKPPIIIAGANDRDGDGLRGKRVYYLGADEYQDWKPEIFNLILRPAMADTRGSKALFTGTPKGKLNHLYKLFEKPKQLPKVYSAYTYPTSANITIPGILEEIEQARLELPPRQFRQEWLASFEDYEGKIYSELDESNLVDWLPEGGQYWLGVDWGDTNPAIVVCRRIPQVSPEDFDRMFQGRVQFDYRVHTKPFWVFEEGWQGNFSLESQGGSPITTPMLHREITRLATKYNLSGALADPSRPASILELRSLGQREGIRGLLNSYEGYNGIQEGLDYVHSLIHQKRFIIRRSRPKDNRWSVIGSEFYQLASAYHRAKHRDGYILEKVEDGQNDHLIDALRYLLTPSPKAYSPAG
jgi:hypothetical protein